MTFLSDPDETGFRRTEIFQFLAQDGVQLSQAVMSSTPEESAPDWAQARRGLRRLSLAEAANVLIGVDPLDGEWRGDDEWREFESAKRMLQQAVEDGEIQSVDLDFKNDSVEIFSSSDLRTWAISHGYVWPIPELSNSAHLAPNSHPASSELLRRFQDSERERIKLQDDVLRLQARVEEAGRRDGKLAEQATQIGKLQAELDATKTEFQRLQAEIGQGKGLSTWQKLAIGMAIGGYKFDPAAARNSAISEIISDLQELGLQLTDDTVRARLRDAADLHLGKRT